MKQFSLLSLCLLIFIFLSAADMYAKTEASVKFSISREENPQGAKNTLTLPYAFPSDSLGFSIGVGSGARGYGQDQLLVGGTVLGSFDGAGIGILGLWDYNIPWFKRFFFSALGSVGHYPAQRAYAYPFFPPDAIRSGSNESDKDDYVETEGWDNWSDFTLEYVLPIGKAGTRGILSYRTRNGLLLSEPSGGETWNPLKSGVTVLLLQQFNRYQSYEPEELSEVDVTVHPFRLALYHNNTDFPPNPSTGSAQYLAITHDFAWLESEDVWTFVEFEASKYFSLGKSDWARQRIIALNFWTGDAPGWEEHLADGGVIVTSGSPTFNQGATLGGFYKMRGYPQNRFHDRSVIYTSAEYRYTLDWNPLAGISWLQFLHTDWLQLVGFAEGGRVANEYDFSELFSDWKVDAGVGLRAMMSGGVVRFDVGASDEGVNAWVMFGLPF
ncbi:MAG: BamA/TamA family outer membrane protein [Desulfobulbaceae bacterium]|nr:BamA/TamA family outer membrane protein [Desulfobulbaceae bacterium]